MAPFQSSPETKTFAEVVAGTLKATAKPSMTASISGNSGSIEFEPTNDQKRRTFAEVVTAIKGLTLTEDIKSMSPPRPANPVIEEPKQRAVMISHKLPGDGAANLPPAGDTPNAESNHICQPTSDIAEEAKSRSEQSISVFSVSKKADVDEQDFILQHDPADWKFQLDTSPQDSTSQTSPSHFQPHWTPKSPEAFANTVDPALESAEYRSVPPVEFTSGKDCAVTSSLPTPFPYTITWRTIRHDGVHIAQCIQGKIVAITMNEFIQTPSGRKWSPRSKRYGIQRDGKFLGSELPDGGKGLIKITWVILGLAGRIHVFTVLALPDVSLLILDNLDADETANFRCHDTARVPFPESLDCLMYVSREEPIKNTPRFRSYPEKLVMSQSTTMARGRSYLKWRAQSYDGTSLYHSVHGPIKLLHTASISRNRMERKEYRSIVGGEITNGASDAGMAIAWEASDDTGSLHRFVVTATPCVEVAIVKVEERLHAVGQISIANEVSSEVCGERQKLMPCGLKGSGNTTVPKDPGAQSGSNGANSQDSAPESSQAETVVMEDSAILRSRNTTFTPSSTQGLALSEQNAEKKSEVAAARSKIPWPNQGSGCPDDQKPDPTNPKKRKLTWPPKSRTGSHWSRDHQQNKQRNQEQQIRLQEQQLRFQEQQMRFQEQMRIQEQQTMAMVQVQRTQPAVQVLQQQMRDFHPARVQQVGKRFVHLDLQLNFN